MRFRELLMVETPIDYDPEPYPAYTDYTPDHGKKIANQPLQLTHQHTNFHKLPAYQHINTITWVFCEVGQ